MVLPESSELVSVFRHLLVGLRPSVGPADASATADDTFESSPAATAEEFEAIASNEVATATSPNYADEKSAGKFELKRLTEDEDNDYNGDGEVGVRRRRRGQRLRY